MNGDPPDGGPRGYLPDRAAKRARKIVLREQMGIGWPVAALVAGVVLAGIALVYLLTRAGPPAPPFVPSVPIERIDPRGAGLVDVDGTKVLVVRAGGGVRVFLSPGDAVAYCPDSRRVESSDDVWSLTGRRTGGNGDSLQPLRAQVHEGRLYIDLRPHVPPPAPEPLGERPVCGSAPG